MRRNNKKSWCAFLSQFWWVFTIIMLVVVAIAQNEQKTNGQAADLIDHEPTTNTTLNKELQRLLAEHPMEEVSKQLWGEITSGEVDVEWNYNTGSFGHFTWYPRESIGINPQYILRAMQSETNRRILIAAVYHEAIHHRQYHDNTKSKYKDECEEYWFSEREAYMEECILAKQLGVQKEKRLCRAIEAGTFDKELLAGLLERDANFSQCGHLRTHVATNDIQ